MRENHGKKGIIYAENLVKALLCAYLVTGMFLLILVQQAVRSIRMSEFADIRLSVSVGGVCGVHPITEAIRKADCLMYLDKAEQQP